MKYKNGEEFLNSLYNDMHMEEVVMHTAKKSDSPTEKISKYLERLERIHNKAVTSNHKMKILKKFYYEKYVIKELPESYVNLQKRIAKERGYGEIDVNEDIRKEMLLNVQKVQKNSLDMWIDYLASNYAIYPIWFKYYVFRGMLKLNKFNKEQRTFSKRAKTTTEPYIELNREVLAKVYDTLVKEIGNDEQIDESISKALENGESFKKLYEYYLTKTEHVNRDNNTDGIWIKYDQGSDYKLLWVSLQGKNTGWCTAGEQNAHNQLSDGDFYVYYTKDNEGKYTEPRIAIRMDGKSEIGEVRGVGENQNLEGCMTNIALEKLNEFPDKDKYLKKVNDMKLLTEIDNKVKENKELTGDELKFLYEINYKIEGFGYDDDPRIQQIKDKRNIKKDLTIMFNCKEKNIGTKLSDFENNPIICFYGNLKYDKETVISNLKELRYITGTADFRNLKSAEGLNNLQSIGHEARFDLLTSAKGLSNLQSIGWGALFNSLTDAKGLNNLQSIGWDAEFDSLINAEGLEQLQSIGWDAWFDSLISAKGLNNLRSIGYDAHFNNLKSAKGLEQLQSIERDAWFDSLINAEGLNNLRSIGADGYFRNLKGAKGLEQLQCIGGRAFFCSLISAEGLDSLETVNGEDAMIFKDEINNKSSKTK